MSKKEKIEKSIVFLQLELSSDTNKKLGILAIERDDTKKGLALKLLEKALEEAGK